VFQQEIIEHSLSNVPVVLAPFGVRPTTVPWGPGFCTDQLGLIKFLYSGKTIPGLCIDVISTLVEIT